ncbi:MAG: DUF1295 domain-containing protein [Jatrophihabitans sp.]
MSFPLGAFFASLGWAALAVLVLLSITFAIGSRIGRHNVVDVAWGGGFGVAALAVLLTSFSNGDGLRRVLLLVMVLVWGGRLAFHIAMRGRGKGEDPRYAQLLSKAKGNPAWYAFRMIYLLQGVLVLFISLPVQVGMIERGGVTIVGWIGVVIWAVGLFFEATGDRQMEQFKSDPANKGKLIDIGLWRYTRHPNYFGDACVWVGLFLLAAERWPGVLTMLSPAVIIYLLAFGSGKKLLEKSMAKRPGYADYQHRTSGFIPLPPKKTGSAKPGG